MNGTAERLTGHAAVEYAERHGLTLSKYADPTEGGRDGLSVAEAAMVAREDASLLYLDVEVRYYVISRQYVGPSRTPRPRDVALVTTDAPRTNMSHEVRLSGWLGTTDDWAAYAHGEYATQAEAEAAARQLGAVAGGTYEIDDQEEYTLDGETVLAIGLGDHDPRDEWDAANWLAGSTLEEVGLSAESTDAEVKATAAELLREARADGIWIGGGYQALARVLRRRIEMEA